LKIFSILFLSLFIVACSGGDFPKFPQIEYVYEIDTDNKACAQFLVVSLDPFKLKYDKDLPIESCNGLMGLKPGDVQKIMNFKDDAKHWAEKHKQCFK